MDITHAMQERSRLPTHRFHQFATSVTETGHRKRTGEIEKTVSIDVPHIRSLGTFPEDRPVFVQEGHVARFVTAQFFREAQ